ncbi:hypothetical protein OOK41_04975 [Micromonospora sp. NBC_01655]|uniref:hypothetical protein n=1 Tax=Micromonospora sp. NBC_01655 TaxID=2975983 RepID=UPI0022511191|nr:hypothetical protein [Micromonospora sp. NBC_01655]MCX4469656.1 hypothetical protein [Micromonospora sp. NBC_01655]
MPAPVAVTVRRESRLLPVLFWTGVALAPVAALILLVADGNGPLRFAAVLAIAAVVLIGLSIALRAEGGSRAEIEDLHDEIEELRRELRGEVVAAAQRGNQALDASQRVQDQVAALRRRLDAAAAGIAADPEPAAGEPVGAGRARVPLAGAYDDAHRPRNTDDAPAGRVRGPGTAHDDDPSVRRPRPDPRHGAERPAQPGGPGPAPRPVEPDARSAAAEPVPRQLGMVRHTETVHVTTRHTVVDGPDPGMGPYGDGPAGRWSPTPQERPWAGAAGPEPEGRRAGYVDPSAHARPEPPDDRFWPPQPAGRHAPGRSAARAAPAWPGPEEEPARSAPRDEPGRGVRHDEAPRDEAAWGTGRPADAGRPGQHDDAGRSGHRDGPGRDGPGGSRHADRGSWDAPARPVPSADAGRARPHPSGPAPTGPDQWSELRAGDRWAEVRDDERGREVRLGERRATAHADAAGTGYRVEDRWASVRRSEPRPGTDQGERWWDEDPGGPRPEPDRPSGHQRADGRYGYPPRDDPPRDGGARPADRWP